MLIFKNSLYNKTTVITLDNGGFHAIVPLTKETIMNKLCAFVVAACTTFIPPVSAATVTSSWYGAAWNGRPTASGEIFHHRKLTVAHRTLPLGTRVLITHGKRKVLARVNDRGPYVRGRGLDVSQAVAQRLGFQHKGLARVHVKVLPKK
jgi:rare lipoprotein A